MKKAKTIQDRASQQIKAILLRKIYILNVKLNLRDPSDSPIFGKKERKIKVLGNKLKTFILN